MKTLEVRDAVVVSRQAVEGFFVCLFIWQGIKTKTGFCSFFFTLDILTGLYFIHPQLPLAPNCLCKMLIDPIVDKDITVEIKHETTPLDHQQHVLFSRELFLSAKKHLIQSYYITQVSILWFSKKTQRFGIIY